MSEAAHYDLGVQRNEDYIPHEYRLTDADENPIDLTGWSFSMNINTGYAITPETLTIEDTPTANGSYISITDAADGAFELFIAKEDMAALPGEDDETTALVHNIIGVDNEGHTRIVARGAFYAEPGV